MTPRGNNVGLPTPSIRGNPTGLPNIKGPTPQGPRLAPPAAPKK